MSSKEKESELIKKRDFILSQLNVLDKVLAGEFLNVLYNSVPPDKKRKFIEEIYKKIIELKERFREMVKEEIGRMVNSF